MHGACDGQEMASDLLVLELQIVMSQHVGLEIKLGFSVRAQVLLTA